MELLKFATPLLTALALLTPVAARAAAPDAALDTRQEQVNAAAKQLCHSTEEFKKALKFLRDSRDFTFHEDVSRLIAEQVAGGCDGAAQRFSRVITLLKSVGMSEKKSLTMALEFAQTDTEIQKNFVEIFTRAYLSEFFDYEFPRAMQLALDLSRGYRGDPAMARVDFIALTRFCKDTKSLDLPMKFCAEYAEKLAKLSQFYASGVQGAFKTLYASLREKKDLSLDVKTALQMSYDILAHGPLAGENFLSAYQTATTNLELTKKPAMEFALRMATRSHSQATPPILQFPPVTATTNSNQDGDVTATTMPIAP